MKNTFLALLSALSLATSTAQSTALPRGPGGAEHLERLAGESNAAFVARAFKLPMDDAHIVAVNWNGVSALFVDFEEDADKDAPERPFFVLLREPEGTYRRVFITMGETEGGSPDVAAIGFANADRDPAKELIVLLAWSQFHNGGCWPIYEVRIFDDAKSDAASLRQLPISKNFGGGCGEPQPFRYATVASVKAELKRLGY